MKKVLKYAEYLLALIFLLIATQITYVKVALPDVGEAEVLQLVYTKERIEDV